MEQTPITAAVALRLANRGLDVASDKRDIQFTNPRIKEIGLRMLAIRKEYEELYKELEQLAAKETEIHD